jgi:hypothetical protein
MLYQLASGKTIYLSVEAYLSLTDEDLQYILSTGVGSSPNNPFHDSVIKKASLADDDDDEEEEDDTSLDYEHEDSEIIIDRSINLDDLPDQQTLD